jgi:hypothetical protein
MTDDFVAVGVRVDFYRDLFLRGWGDYVGSMFRDGFRVRAIPRAGEGIGHLGPWIKAFPYGLVSAVEHDLGADGGRIVLVVQTSWFGDGATDRPLGEFAERGWHWIPNESPDV